LFKLYKLVHQYAKGITFEGMGKQQLVKVVIIVFPLLAHVIEETAVVSDGVVCKECFHLL